MTNRVRKLSPAIFTFGLIFCFFLSLSNPYQEHIVASSAGIQLGNTTRLTTNAARDIEPTWSPDGSTIAFLSDRIGGSDGTDLFAINPDGTQERLLAQFTFTDTFGGRFGNPSWLGSTGDLLVMEFKSLHELMRFRLTDATTSNALPVTRNISNGNSPFLDQLLFVPGGQLGVSPVTHGSSKLAWATLVNPSQRIYQVRVFEGSLDSFIGNTDTAGTSVFQTDPDGQISYPDGKTVTFSPDGSKLCIAACVSGWSQGKRRDLYIIDFATGETQRLTTTGEQGQDNTSVAWSSQNIIAFASRPGDSSTYDLYTIQPDGTDITRLSDTSWNEIDPTWSPDGSKIVFASDMGGNYDLYISELNECAILCPSDITISNAQGQCGAVVMFADPTPVGAGCGAITCVPASSSFFPVGITTVTCMAENGSGSTTCPPVTITGTLGSGSPDWPSISGIQTGRLNRNGVSSTCAVPKSCVIFDSTPGRAFDAYTFTNNSGGTACVTVTLNVLTQAGANYQVNAYLGTYDPANVCTNYLADPGLSSGSPPTPTNFSFNVPGGMDFVLVVHTNNPGEIGGQYELMLSQLCNSGGCTFTVTVNDTEAPVIICPADVTIAAPEGSNCAVVNYSSPTTIDNCSVASVVCSPPSGTCFSIGTTTVTCTAIDGENNIASCSFSIVVQGPLSGTIGIWDGTLWPLDGNAVRSIKVVATRNDGFKKEVDATSTKPNYRINDLPQGIYNLTVELDYVEVITVNNSDSCLLILKGGCDGRALRKTVRKTITNVQLPKLRQDFELPLPLVFVHGILNCYEKWYSPGDSIEARSHWDNFARERGFICLTPNYNFIINNSNSWETAAFSVQNHIETVFRTLTSRVTTTNYPNWVYVGYSQGGLIARVLINNKPGRLVSKLRKIFLLGTPNSGARGDTLSELTCFDYLGETEIQRDFNLKYPTFGPIDITAYAGTRECFAFCKECSPDVTNPGKHDSTVSVDSVHNIYLVVLGRSNLPLQAPKGRPVYVHL